MDDAKPYKFCPYCGNNLGHKIWEGRNRLYCSTCSEPIYENPIPAACAIVLDNNSRLLLVKRNVAPKIGYWCLPGGFIEINESPEMAVLRELKEETNIEGKIDQSLGAMVTTSSLYTSVLILAFFIKPTTFDIKAGDDACDIDYFSFKRLPEIAFASHLSFIRNFQASYSIKPYE